MDRNELINHLQSFKQQCDKENLTIRDIHLEEVYPGMPSTSFIVCLKGFKDWTEEMSYSDVLDKLIDILWRTTEAETRQSIFAVTFYDKDENLSRAIEGCEHS